MSAQTARSLAARAFALSALLALSACATLNREGTVAGPNGGSVTMMQGTALVLALTPDATGANSWAPANVPGPQLWPVVGSDFTVDPKPTDILGIAGTSTYRFRAMAPGTTSVEFALRSPVEVGATPVKVVRYDVTVKPAVLLNLF
jgi:inhibitor of cysteine peptidase